MRWGPGRWSSARCGGDGWWRDRSVTVSSTRAHNSASWGHRRRPLPAGSARRPSRRRDHSGREHRRRHHAARPAHLPGSGQRHVHARRTASTSNEAGVGPRRPGASGRARDLRGGTDLVRPRRPRHRDPPGADPDARRRLPAVRRDRRAVRPVATRCAAAADDRRALRDARGRRSARCGRQAIHFQEWWIRYRAALPAQAFVQVGLDEAKPAPGVLEAIAARRRRAHRPEQPGGEHRDDPQRGGSPGCDDDGRGSGRSASPPSSAPRRCGAWPTPAWPRSASR